MHGRAAKRSETEIPGAGDDRGDSSREGGSVGFVGLVNSGGFRSANCSQDTGRHRGKSVGSIAIQFGGEGTCSVAVSSGELCRLSSKARGRNRAGR